MTNVIVNLPQNSNICLNLQEPSTKNSRSVIDLKCGESAVITSVGNDCLEEECHCLRLLEIGFTPGQEITLLAKSPFDDPLAIAVRGTVISLRRREAECIKI